MRENRCRPYGTRAFAPLRGCSFGGACSNALRSKVVLTQSLKPGFNGAMQHTDKAAPVQTLHETSWQVLDLLGRTVAHGEPVEEGQGDSDKQDQRFVVLDLRQQSGADQHSDDAEKSSPAELEKRPFWPFFP